jgi:hypothetical protein
MELVKVRRHWIFIIFLAFDDVVLETGWNMSALVAFPHYPLLLSSIESLVHRCGDQPIGQILSQWPSIDERH